MRQIKYFILNYFSLFIIFFILFLSTQKVLLFKIANSFDVKNIDIVVFQNYIKSKKIKLHTENRMQKSNKSLLSISQKKKIEKLDRKKFDEELKRYKKLSTNLMSILIIFLAIALIKFFKKVRF